MSPAPGHRDGRQRQRRGQPAQREAGLLDAHRHAALAGRKPLHNRLAGGGIEGAESKAAEDQQREEPDEVRAQGRERDHGADEELTEPEGEANAEAVGQPAGGERHQRTTQIDCGQEEADLHAGERERFEQERRERSHRQGGEGAETVGECHEHQDRPAGRHRVAIVSLSGSLGTIL